MKLKALITVLVLGSSSVAMAQPAFSISGGVKVSAGGSVDIRDHRTSHQRIVRFERQARQPRRSFETYPAYQQTTSTFDGWTTIDSGMPSRYRDSISFEVNAWLGSLRLQSAHGDGLFDAQVIYADGRVVNLTGMSGFYQGNLAPGVVSRIIVRGAPGCWPQLMVSASNH